MGEGGRVGAKQINRNFATEMSFWLFWGESLPDFWQQKYCVQVASPNFDIGIAKWKKPDAPEAENLFKYYEVEEYDSSKRVEQGKKLSVLPAPMALGMLGFFLAVGTSFSLGSSLSSLPPKEQMKAMKKMNKQMASLSFGDGLLQFITYQQHPSFQSPEIKASLN